MSPTETNSSARPDRDRAAPILLWLRRDLRLVDHPALVAALDTGRPVIPVFVWDAVEEALLGAAPRWRLARSLEALQRDLEAIGGRLILQKGDALSALRRLAGAVGAAGVYWSRYYETSFIERDKAIKAALSEAGLETRSFPGFLLREPFETRTQSGGHFKVYTPFQRAFSAAFAADAPAAAPSRWPAPDVWPQTETLEALTLDAAMNRGAAVLARSAGAAAGESAAQRRLAQFLEEGLAGYATRRDRLDQDGTSRLSASLALGEVSPRSVFLAASRAAEQRPGAVDGAEKFIKELIWREFAWHLAYHAPQIATQNWRAEWDAFPWRDEASAGEDLKAWRCGRTGVQVVDAAMRELYVTGVMHNRARMIAGSYLTKNLMIHWRLGERWFADCLVDFDPASNAMGWQWVAGSGPDAAPFFRIFNPDTQAEKFDPNGRYRSRWLPDRPSAAAADLLDHSGNPGSGVDFYAACPRSWGLSPQDPPPQPALTLKEGRERALEAYAALKSAEP